MPNPARCVVESKTWQVALAVRELFETLEAARADGRATFGRAP